MHCGLVVGGDAAKKFRLCASVLQMLLLLLRLCDISSAVRQHPKKHYWSTMAYNYGPPPGAYHARQPSYGQYGAPPSMGPPPGMDLPPGMPAPGMPAHSPGGQPQQQFQMPPNMPNFNAPVIRLGVQDQQKPSSPADRLTSGQGGSGRGDGFRSSNAEPIGRRDRAGLGAGSDSKNLERDRAAVRESMMATSPPTREEVARTIFIGSTLR